MFRGSALVSRRELAQRLLASVRIGYAVVLLSSALLLGYVSFFEESSPETSAEGPRAYLVSFTGVTAQSKDEMGSSSLRAEKVVYRNRSGAGGFILYHDLADLLVTDGRFSIQLNESKGFSSIPETIASLLTPDPAAADLEKETAFDDGPLPALVTRLVFDRVVIDLSGPEMQLSLEAEHGRYDIDSGTFALDGQVVVRTPDGHEIHAANAVLSRDHHGLYLPFGYTRGGQAERGSFFVVVSNQGELSITHGTGRISYEDHIEERERLILHHYLDRVPPELKPLAIAILSGMGSTRL